LPVSLFHIRVNATQAKAELASLAATNRAALASMQAAWSGVNKMFIAGAAGIAAMGGAFAVAYMANKDFNKSMTHTMALSDMTRNEMKALSDQVLGLGIRYGESSNIIADGLVVLAKAGLTQQEIMTAMPTIVQLMKANAVDFETAANIAMMTMNAFSLEYSQLADVGDKAQKAFQATLMDIEDLQQGLQYAASTAAMAGIPFESLLAIMGTLADNAMVAGIASRSMNKMLLDIVMHTDQVQRWADSMGLGVQVIKDGKLNIDEIIPAFAKLGMSLETLIESSDIFTVRALRSWGILIGHADEYDALLGQINASTGELERTTDIQITSLSSMMTTMKEILLEPFKTEAFGEETAAIMRELTVVVADLAPELANLIFNLVVGFKESLPDIINLLQGFLGMFQNILPVIMWFGKALSGISPQLLGIFLVMKLMMKSKIVQWMMGMVLQSEAFVLSLTRQRLETEMLALSNQRLQMSEAMAQQQQQKLQAQMVSLDLQIRSLNIAIEASEMHWTTAVLHLGNYSMATEMASLSTQKLALSHNMEMNANKLATIQKEIELIATKASTQANEQNVAIRQMMVGAVLGIGMGLWMLIGGYNKETRLLGALTTALMAGTAAYYMLAAARAAALPGQTPSQFVAHAGMTAVGIGAMAAGVGALYAYTAPDKEIDYGEFEMPDIPRAQGGMRVVGGQGPQLIMAHPDEQISSANKEASGGGAVIEIRDSMFFDWDSFVQRMREDIGVENIKEIRRYK